MVKHIQTIRRQFPKGCLSVYDDFVGLPLKRVKTNCIALWSSDVYSDPYQTSKMDCFAKRVNGF